MVFQNYALFPHMNVRAQCRLRPDDARHVAKAEIDRRVDEALALVRLGRARATSCPGQLSGGQQQRVAIARAIVIEPPLVLMDEPLSNLDAKLRLEMRAEIRRIHNQLGSTTIYVTHDQDEALSLADRIVVLRDGGVRQVGTPEELYDAPGASRRRRVHGLPQSRCAAGSSRVEGGRATVDASASAAARRASRRSRASRRRRVVVAIRPDDLAVGGRPGVTRHGRDASNIAAANSSASRARPTGPSWSSTPTQRVGAGEPRHARAPIPRARSSLPAAA